MGNKIIKMMMNGGEVSPEFFSMFGDAKHQGSCAKMHNFIAAPHGPAFNRAGTRYVAGIKNDGVARLIPFNFGLSQSFAIETGEGYFRFHTDGGTLQAPTASTWSNATAYVIGDLVLRTGVTYYAIQDGTNKDPTTQTAYWYALPSTGEYEIPNSYNESDLFKIKYEQNADVLTLVCEGYPSCELKRYGNTRWIMEEIDFGSPIAAPGAPTATPTLAGGTTISYSYVVTAVVDNEGESVASSAGTCNNNLWSNGAYNTITWSSVTGASRYNVYKLQGGIYGFIGSTTGTSIVDDNIAPDTASTPPLYESPFVKSGAITAVAITNGGANYPNTYSGGEFTRIRQVSGESDIIPTRTWPITLPEAEYPQLTVSDPTGSGATFKFNPYLSYFDTHSSGGWFIVSCNFDVLTPGSGYTAPVFQLYNPYDGKVYRSKFDYTLSAIIQDVTIAVNDSGGPGIGAEMIPVISGGVVTGITVKSGGSGYVSPTITIVDSTSAGSGFVAGAVTVDDDGDYPGCVSWFEQRKIFAATQKFPQNFWATKTGTDNSLEYHIPVLDDDRISRRIASRQVNKIRHIVPLQDLILLTSSAEWRVTSANSDAITPTSISAKAQSYIGASDVRPVVINNTIIFCAAQGGHVRELGYSADFGGYATGDLSLRASHLFDGHTITDMCITRSPFPVIWVVNDVGSMIGLTYVPEERVFGWHNHGTIKGVFESCCAIEEDENDVMYVIVRRDINGTIKRFVERLQSRQFFELKDAFFVDCGLTYDGAAATTISGLDHLEGETVSILADGAVCQQQVVTSGAITLEVAASTVHVGLPIVADLKTLPASGRMEAYGQGRMKAVNAVWVRVNESSGVWAGPDELSLVEAKQRTTEPYDTPPELSTGEIEIIIRGRWNDAGQVYIRQADPLPLTITSITMDIALGG